MGRPLLAKLLEREFGVVTKSVENRLISTAPVAVTLAMGNNPNRLAWTMINLGVNDLFIGFDMSVSATRGILLASGGGGINLRWNQEFDLVANQVFVTAPAGATAIYYIEIEALRETE